MNNYKRFVGDIMEYLQNVTIRNLTKNDKEKFPGRAFDVMLANGDKIAECGELYCAIDKFDFMKFGYENVRQSAYVSHSAFFGEDFMHIDFAHAAELKNNVPETREVSLVKNLVGVCTAIFEGDDGRHYMRTFSPTLQYAQWNYAYIANKRWEDGAVVKDNTTFKCGDLAETVHFDSGIGEICAFGENYNPEFNDLKLTVAEMLVDATERSIETDTGVAGKQDIAKEF